MAPSSFLFDPSCDDSFLADLGVEGYDAIEIHGERVLSVVADGVVSTSCEVDEDDPDFFSVLLHQKGGGTDCVGDFAAHSSALEYANGLSDRYGWPVYCFVSPSARSSV